MKRKPKYAIRGGKKTFAGIPADVIGNELDRIYKKYGMVKASIVVDENRDEDAPLNHAFLWDIQAAAEQHWLSQARELIRVVVRVETVDNKEVSARQYVHVPPSDQDDGREGSYQPISVVIESPDLFTLALDELRGKLRIAMYAVQELEDAARSSKSVDKDKIAMITLAVKAMNQATAAISALH